MEKYKLETMHYHYTLRNRGHFKLNPFQSNSLKTVRKSTAKVLETISTEKYNWVPRDFSMELKSGLIIDEFNLLPDYDAKYGKEKVEKFSLGLKTKDNALEARIMLDDYWYGECRGTFVGPVGAIGGFLAVGALVSTDLLLTGGLGTAACSYLLVSSEECIRHKNLKIRITPKNDEYSSKERSEYLKIEKNLKKMVL